MPSELARLRTAFAAPEPLRGALPVGASSVLLPLRTVQGELAVLFTLRHQGLKAHAGQWSFPGGRIEAGDKGPVHAALRETEEEVGVPARDVEVLGHLSDYTTYYGRLVCAYVGHFGERAPEPRCAAPDEVEAVLTVPLAQLRDAQAYEGRTLQGQPRGADRVVHYWHLREATVWGITAELLARFLARAYGWAPPREPTVIATSAEFRELARRGL